MKLLIAKPQEGESVSSVLDRAASLYGTTRACLLSELRYRYAEAGDDSWSKDIDVTPPSWLVTGLADQFDCNPEDIEVLKLHGSAWLLEPQNRDVYCDFCFGEDYREIGTVYFRKQWALSFLTHCPRHRMPLSHWTNFVPPTDHMGRGVPVNVGTSTLLRRSEGWPDPPFPEPWTAGLREVWRRIFQCEGELVSRYYVDPSAFDDNTRYLREFILLFAGNWQDERTKSLMFYISPLLTHAFPGPVDCRVFDIPRQATRPSADVAEAWDYYLCHADPQWRRAATWLVTQLLSHEQPLDAEYGWHTETRSGNPFASLSREEWILHCFHQLPEFARGLVGHFSNQWPVELRRAAEKLLDRPVEPQVT